LRLIHDVRCGALDTRLILPGTETVDLSRYVDLLDLYIESNFVEICLEDLGFGQGRLAPRDNQEREGRLQPLRPDFSCQQLLGLCQVGRRRWEVGVPIWHAGGEPSSAPLA